MSRNQGVPLARSLVGGILAASLATAAVAWAEPPARSLPIGVFDSGTGGLAVLEQILKMDLFDNQTHAPVEKGDGRPDFQQERFVFLADQANMPYGNYPMVGKERFLVGLVENDARFLLGNQYFASPTAPAPSTDKQTAKAIVIACNTATAYAKADVQSLAAKAGTGFEVIGVIDAGAQGGLEALAQGPAGTIGILATEGTAASGAYPRAIRELARKTGLPGEIPTVQQGAYGLAGAVDGAPEFIVRNPASDRPRPEYRGPSLGNPLAPIDRKLLPRYCFDFSGHGMLWQGDRENPSALQINSVENYLAHHLVSLLERLRAAPDAKPLAVMILGCTHYPFLADSIRAQLTRLYDLREDGRYIYRQHMVGDVKLIDPALSVGKELYRRLASQRRLADVAAPAALRGEFYITVPCREHPGVQVNADGWFTYEYKYGRGPGPTPSDVRAVPWNEKYLDAEVVRRLARQVPAVSRLIAEFQASSAKVRAGQAAASTGAADDVLRVGVAAVDITPPGGQVLDPLYAKAIVLSQGKQMAALVECDLTMVSPEVSEQARQAAADRTGIPAANICIAATHTHNGAPGCDDLPGRIARAVVEAHAAARPARLEAGIARQEETISFNRRYLMRDGTVRFNPGFLNPDVVRPVGPIDPEVGIVLVRQADGNRPVAALINFALHACTVGRGGVTSADFPYALERTLRKDLGEKFLSIYVAGACGDVNHFDVTRPYWGRTWNQGQTFLTPYVPAKTDKPAKALTYEYIGEALAKTVEADLPKLTPVAQPSLGVRCQVVQVPLATFSDMDLAWAKTAIEKPSSFLTGIRARRILSLAQMRKKGDTIPLEVQAIRLGSDTALVTLPGEIFVELGMTLKKASPFKTTLVVERPGASRICYVPTRKAFVEGDYEVVNSRLESGGGEMLVENALRLLKELKRN